MLELDTESSMLEVHLPRLKLDFFVDKTLKLQSKQFRGMAVDTNQSCGTITGLKNKLVLRAIQGSSRTILIPHGTVRYSKNGYHHIVQIDTDTSGHIKYHLYELDPLLGRLVDTGNYTSRLFRILIHAVTGHTLPDKLTGRTGTEQALHHLEEAFIQSIRSLSSEDVRILNAIAELTPRREFYPGHLRVMQQVRWHDLAAHAQHESFSTIVGSIFQRARNFEIFSDHTELPDSRKYGDEDLLQRAIIRNAVFRGPGFGAENHTIKYDVDYVSREISVQNKNEICACNTAKLVNQWSTELEVSSSLLCEIESWGQTLCGTYKDANLLRYDEEWLEGPNEVFSEHWCSLQSLISDSDITYQKYSLMTFLSTLAYSGRTDQQLVQTLLAFATVPELRALKLPQYNTFRLGRGYKPDRTELMLDLSTCTRPFHDCPESKLPQLASEPHWEPADAQRRDEHERARDEEAYALIDTFMSQWPCEKVSIPRDDLCTYHISGRVLETIQPKFTTWFINKAFHDHVKVVQDILDGLRPSRDPSVAYSYSTPTYQPYPVLPAYIDWDCLFSRPAPPVNVAADKDLSGYFRLCESESDHSKTETLIKRLLTQTTDHYGQEYGRDLLQSLKSLQSSRERKHELCGPTENLNQIIMKNIEYRRSETSEIFQKIRWAFRLEDSVARSLACDVGLCPRLSTCSLLQHLSTKSLMAINIPSCWKSVLVQFGLSITALQKYERLLACMHDTSELLKEITNQGHQGWDALQHPEWLLFEIENNILIRPVQARIAQEMISPSSGKNAIVQLNMGEGKSSVIAPIVAATLADRHKLARIFVLPSLSAQMFQMLRKKVGGILNRRIYSMPFSRSLQLSVTQAAHIRNLYEECRRDGGVFLCQPEHILSFELMGIERSLSDGQDFEVAKILVDTQKWLDQCSQDVLDESDEILSVQFELIYTMGSQQAIEFSPNRWKLIMCVLAIVKDCVQEPNLHATFHGGFQIGPVKPGAFPRIQILESAAGNRLMEMIANRICEGKLTNLPVWRCSPNVRKEMYKYLTDARFREGDAVTELHSSFNTDLGRTTLLLLKGLIAHGVLAFILKEKRWRVNYGLDLSRSMLAVPYRAKDLPALRAEFSHPDVTIGLTCLSYYYGGLTDDQLFLCFEKLLCCDNAQAEFESWIHDVTSLPEAFHKLTGINLRDTVQCINEIFPRLRYVKNVIDFYLSHLVFPKEMKEFPSKLSSSGWDIARSKTHPTTGFSGTNDSRYILPLSIMQADLPEQAHTNATVLNCILQPVNTYQAIPRFEAIISLLDIVVSASPSVRVIIDVGALVLEWRNHEMAREWLYRVPASEALAVIFFDDKDELVVLTRDGVIEPLLISPFSKHTNQCLVYLDEAHTRGTDLKLPRTYRAAVTLSLRLTKDRLVQGMSYPTN